MLTSRFVETVKTPGRYPDGRGLRLQVSKSGSKSWLFRYTVKGRKPREIAIVGGYPTVSLSAARKRSHEMRQLVVQGIDPQEHESAARERDALKRHTFREAAEKFVVGRRTSKRVLGIRRSQLERYVYPKIGDRLVDSIDNPHVIDVLEPIRVDFPSLVDPIRWLMKRSIDAAVQMRWRDRTKANPADLPEMDSVFDLGWESQSYASLPWTQIPEFMTKLRSLSDSAWRQASQPEKKSGGQPLTHVAADCLEFIILCGLRKSNGCVARWADIDLDDRIWTIPGCDNSIDGRIGTRMKERGSHSVPITDAAMAILRRYVGRSNEWVFSGRSDSVPINAMVLHRLIKSMGYTDSKSLDKSGNPKSITLHGFRSTISTWVADATEYSDDLADLVLAHEMGPLRRLYKRTKQFDKRRELLEDWASFCSKPPVEILPFRRALGE